MIINTLKIKPLVRWEPPSNFIPCFNIRLIWNVSNWYLYCTHVDRMFDGIFFCISTNYFSFNVSNSRSTSPMSFPIIKEKCEFLARYKHKHIQTNKGTKKSYREKILLFIGKLRGAMKIRLSRNSSINRFILINVSI